MSAILPLARSGRAGTLALLGAASAAGGIAAWAWLPPSLAAVVTLLVFCIGAWASAVVPEYWPALAFFSVATLAKLAPPALIFSGLVSTTFWLLFSGAVMGAAIAHTGLGRRAAALLARLVGRRYGGIIGAIVLFNVALAFVMPSGMGRVVLMIPVTLAVAEQIGYGAGHPGRTGMLVAAAIAGFLPSFAILPANAPNMILAGMADTLYGVRIAYVHYLVLHFPVLGALKSVLLVLLVVRMFPAADPAAAPVIVPAVPGSAPVPAAPLSAPERRLAVLLAACLALWLTDGVHHVSPAWIGLAAALVCLWPDAGLTPPNCINRDINYGTLLFVAGVIGLGAVIATSGLGDIVVGALRRHAHFGAATPFWNAQVLALIATVVGLLTNLAGVPATLSPLARDLAAATGLPLTTVLMTQVLGFSNVCLPYQAPPLIFAMQTAGLPARAVARLCVALFIVSLVVLTPLELLWWRVLGVL